ncbi:MAG: MATE family efflux transporter [Gammaproteobacteria bacterium]|nr:MAG: MATE family efflux transporter [Gammaproteobacteria bacterium]
MFKNFNFHFDIPKLAFPLILSNLTVPMLGFINTIIVGHFQNQSYLAAIGLGTMIFNFIYWGLGFFRMTTTALISHAYGERNKSKINDILLHSIYLAIVIGLSLIILQYPLFRFFSLWIHPNQEINNLMRQYYNIRIWGAPAVLINFIVVGILIGIQKTRGPLVLLIITNFLAILLSIFLGVILQLKLIGIAWSDVLSQYIGLLVGIYLISHYLNFKNIFIKTKIKLHKFKPLLSANRDIFIRSLCLIIVFTFFTIWSGYISVLVLAVNTLLMNFFQIMSNALGGFDNVAEAFSGQAIGEKNIIKFKKNIFIVGYWALACSLLFSIIYLLFGHTFINWMTNIQLVKDMASDYMPFMILFPLVSFVSFLLDGIAIGANLFKEMRNGMILTVILFFGIWYVLKPYGNLGLWLAFYSFFILRALILGYFIRNFYLKHRFM